MTVSMYAHVSETELLACRKQKNQGGGDKSE